MGCRTSKTIDKEESVNIEYVFNKGTIDEQTHKPTNASLADRIKFGTENKRNQENKKSRKFDPKITAKYEIKAPIGEGSMTAVYRIENRTTREPYALKLLTKPVGLPAMKRECDTLIHIKNRNTIKMHEVLVDKTNTPIALVLELMTGGSLYSRIHEKGIFTEKNAAKVLRQVLSGVAYLHSLGITHRGLTIHNILFYHQGKDSRVVITDFATAHTKKSTDDIEMRRRCGSCEYMAPEIVKLQSYTQAVDVWAVGVIAYAMMAAEFPFPPHDKQAMFRAIAKAEYSLDSQAWQERSESCRNFVSSLLTLDAGLRPSATDAMQLAWLAERARHTESKGHRSSGNSTEARPAIASRRPAAAANPPSHSAAILKHPELYSRSSSSHVIACKYDYSLQFKQNRQRNMN